MPSNIAVFGLGYVGCVTSACLARLGHSVIGVDRDQRKLDEIAGKRAPFYEPGLNDLIESGIDRGLLSVTPSTTDALENADVAFICVGTPSIRNGNDPDLDQLRHAMEDLILSLRGRLRPLVLAIRSTVPPGTCEGIVTPALAAFPGVSVVAHPEFLREGTAVADFLDPSLIVIGGSDSVAMDKVANLYRALPCDTSLVSLRAAELIKYACNAFHAIKVAFANEIGALSGEMEVDGLEVMRTLCKDTKLNASAAYLAPGFAFGGSCLPKDLRALTALGAGLGMELPLLNHALPSNQAHFMRAVKRVCNIDARKLGVLGLAFKEDTDDLRESRTIDLLNQILSTDRQVRVYDAQIDLDTIHGANKLYLLSQVPKIAPLLVREVSELLNWADHLVIAQKQSPAISAQVRKSGLPVTDLVGSGLDSL